MTTMSSRILNPTFRFISSEDMNSNTEFAWSELILNFLEEEITVTDDNRISINERIFITFEEERPEVYKYVVSFPSELSDLGVKICCFLSRIFDIF
ncbi:unnamed protein product [Hymenolepis diminuta]|uniref:Uncharacterized protein n=1 Tax=Hymenolepis diminuta TaxID=6216 RepID=A0A564YXU9_HYMDI|nr:unnamed protein product [Hymenolepis diminuta]